MKICGIKLTHDGSLCLIDNGELIFSFEMEKLNNNYRYKNFCITMDEVAQILSDFGYDISDIDTWVVDGWRGKQLGNRSVLKNVVLFKEVWEDMFLANYGHLVKENENILIPEYHELKHTNFKYESYLHLTGHIFAGYCISPFAKKNESSYILVWDGEMPPQFFYYEPTTNKVTNLGPLFFLSGSLYMDLPRQYSPFSNYYKYDFSIAGKVMAVIALGEIKKDILVAYQKIYERLMERMKKDEADPQFTHDTTNSFVKCAKEYSDEHEIEPLDMLTSMHQFIETLLVENLKGMLEKHMDLTKNLCIVGGCALNIKWNSSIREQGIFNEVWIPPFPNDSGNGIGAACASMIVNTNKRALKWGVYSGPKFNNTLSIDSAYKPLQYTLKDLAQLIYDTNEPILLLNGRAELGPRALGNRSILASARSTKMKLLLNELKIRETYRPVAPICLEEYGPEVFSPGTPDPYMLFEHTVRDEWKDKVPAIVHLDGSARLQTVNQEQNPVIFQLLTHYHSISGIPLLCNTSANLKGSGFFPDIDSAIRWGSINYIWSEGILYKKS